MAMNIYQKTKVIMLESNKCIPLYNKLAKILVESNDETLNDFINKIRSLVGNGRIIGNENRSMFGETKNEMITYCDLKINDKTDLKTELKNLLNDYKTKLNEREKSKSYDDFSYGCDVDTLDILEEIIENLEDLLKKF